MSVQLKNLCIKLCYTASEVSCELVALAADDLTPAAPASATAHDLWYHVARWHGDCLRFLAKLFHVLEELLVGADILLDLLHS